MTFALLPKRLRLRSPAFALILGIALFSPAPVWARDDGQPALSADALLRAAVANEKPGANSGYFAWMDRLQKPRGSVTKLMVDTPQGILSRTVAINDRPLSADERQQDDARIDRLLDPAMMREKAKRQREDQQHIERLLAALPNALRCSYASAGDEEHVLRLECTPNPGFSPQNFESQVLLGMKAEILIDRDQKRITKITGTLVKDVIFGWGIVAKLNRGGRIEIRQSRVADKHWDITHMELLFDGHIIVIKPLHIEETESAWSYRPVPGMSVAQALDFLRNDSLANQPAAPARPALDAKE